MMSQWIRFFRKSSQRVVHYFAHIPKTAGTSFIVLLDRFFPVAHIYPNQLWREAGKVDLTANQKYSLFRGHFGGGGLSVLTDQQIHYFTILRNPNALALSTFNFVKRESNTKVHHLLKNKDMGFLDFLNHPMTSALVSNRMVRNLSFDFKQDPAAQEVFLSAETIEYLQPIIQSNKPSISDSKRLHRAKKFIQRCQWFGLLERFDESLQLLCYHMHWPPIGQTQKLNTHNDKSDFNEQEIAKLAKLNQQDNQLYLFSEVIFEQKLKQMKQALLSFKTKDDQSIDELLDLSYQQHQSKLVTKKPIESFCYGFDQVLLGNQWHRREMMQPEESYFRWTGPGASASIDFWLPVQNYDISIRIINATSTDILDRLNLTINKKRVNWRTEDRGVVRVLRLHCPADLIQKNGLLRLALECDSMITHQQAFDSDDERLVGVAVHWIQFKHVC